MSKPGHENKSWLEKHKPAMTDGMADSSHTRNPDMVAFTIGRITLGLMASGRPVDMDMIVRQLSHISRNGPLAGVSPEMAQGALSEITDLRRNAA